MVSIGQIVQFYCVDRKFNDTIKHMKGLAACDAPLKLVPGLAQKWGVVKPTAWRFELRKGVQFHDGQPLTAEDVMFSIDRARGEGSDNYMFFRWISVRDIKQAK